MTTARQIKGLSASLLARHPDLIDSGKNTLWLTPINHVGRLILIDRTSNPAYCVVSWHLVELFMPQYTSWNCLGRCGDRIFRSKHYRGGQGWFWSDPTIYQDFVDRLEAEALPLFRSLNTTRRCLEFPRSHPHWSGFLDHHWHVAACIALGEIERAQELWSEIRRHYVEEEPSENRAEQLRHRRFRELDRPLRAGDRAALSALLARWEAENVVGTPLEPHWQRAGLPLDDVC